MSIFDIFRPKTAKQKKISRIIAPVIEVFIRASNLEDEAEIIEEICRYTREDADLAWELYCFIPIVYSRLLLPEVKYAGEVILALPNGESRSMSLESFDTYLFLQQLIAKRYKAGADTKIEAILKYSAEYNAVHKALNNGSKLENLEMGPPTLAVPCNVETYLSSI